MRPALLLAVAFAAACGNDPEPVRTGVTAGFEWAILSAESGNDLVSDSGPFFQAGADDVRAALEGIRDELQRQMTVELDPEVADTEIWREMVGEVIGRVPGYRCQVVGVVGEDERRYLYLNFFVGIPPPEEGGHEPLADWTRRAYVVDDGGSAYWQVRYYPATGTFEEMWINGEA